MMEEIKDEILNDIKEEFKYMRKEICDKLKEIHKEISDGLSSLRSTTSTDNSNRISQRKLITDSDDDEDGNNDSGSHG